MQTSGRGLTAARGAGCPFSCRVRLRPWRAILGLGVLVAVGFPLVFGNVAETRAAPVDEQEMMAAAVRIINAMRPRSDERGQAVTLATRRAVHHLLAVQRAVAGDAHGALDYISAGRRRADAATVHRLDPLGDLPALQELVAIRAGLGGLSDAQWLAQEGAALLAPEDRAIASRLSWTLLNSAIAGLLTARPGGPGAAAAQALDIAATLRTSAPQAYAVALRHLAQGLAATGDPEFGAALIVQNDDPLLARHYAIGLARWGETTGAEALAATRRDIADALAAEWAMAGRMADAWRQFRTADVASIENPDRVSLAAWMAVQSARHEGVLGLAALLDRFVGMPPDVLAEISRGFAIGLGTTGATTSAAFILRDLVPAGPLRTEAWRSLLLEAARRGHYESAIALIEPVMAVDERRTLANDLIKTLAMTASPQWFRALPLDVYSHAPLVDVLTRADGPGADSFGTTGPLAPDSGTWPSQIALAVARLSAAAVAMSQIALSVP